MSDEPKKRSRAWIWRTVALFSLYPLSIGPANRICVTVGGHAMEIYGTIYGPLHSICERTPVLNAARRVHRTMVDWPLNSHAKPQKPVSTAGTTVVVGVVPEFEIGEK